VDDLGLQVANQRKKTAFLRNRWQLVSRVRERPGGCLNIQFPRAYSTVKWIGADVTVWPLNVALIVNV
jgi:hypothetical protein